VVWGDVVITEGFYSVVRYSPNPARDEVKAVALMLVDEQRDLAQLRVAPLSQITPRLTEHGLLDEMLVRLATRMQAGEIRSRIEVEDLRGAIGPTLSLTPPMPAAITDDIDVSLKALYGALVAPRQGREAGISRGQILDRLVRACRKAGASIAPGSYLDDVLFDAVVSSSSGRVPVQVLSFETETENPRGVEQAAGHFLFGLSRVHEGGVCVIQPPFDRSSEPARASFRRVSRWMSDEGVSILRPDEMPQLASSMAGVETLPLVMST